MSTVMIQATELRNEGWRDQLTQSLPDAARLLAPPAFQPGLYASDSLIEVRVEIDTPSEEQVRSFIDRILALSDQIPATYSLDVTLDQFARLRMLATYPGHILGDGHVVWVRPSERRVLEGFFKYLFGSHAP